MAPTVQRCPVNQQALDTSLASSGTDVQARFADTIGLTTTVAVPSQRPAGGQQSDVASDAPLPLTEQHQVRHPVDGKPMTLVEDGVFLAGEDNQPVWLAAFYIDVFPTTNTDYARFIAATGHTPPQHWNDKTTPPDTLYDHPVVFVAWHDAAAYATWAAKQLPTSQQWEKAARGSRGDTYPWGSQLTPAKCNVRESSLRTTTPVTRYHSGVSPYGAYDMCGNTWEWCSTQTKPERYELKGSAFTSPFFRATPSTFNDASADMRDDDTGFRTATPAETMRALLNIKN